MFADLLELLSQWGGPGSADFDGSGTVGVSDLLQLLGAWGTCMGPSSLSGSIPQSVEDCLDRFDLGTLELEKCIEAVESGS